MYTPCSSISNKKTEGYKRVGVKERPVIKSVAAMARRVQFGQQIVAASERQHHDCDVDEKYFTIARLKSASVHPAEDIEGDKLRNLFFQTTTVVPAVVAVVVPAVVPAAVVPAGVEEAGSDDDDIFASAAVHRGARARRAARALIYKNQ